MRSPVRIRVAAPDTPEGIPSGLWFFMGQMHRRLPVTRRFRGCLELLLCAAIGICPICRAKPTSPPTARKHRRTTPPTATDKSGSQHSLKANIRVWISRARRSRNPITPRADDNLASPYVGEAQRSIVLLCCAEEALPSQSALLTAPPQGSLNNSSEPLAALHTFLHKGRLTIPTARSFALRSG